MIGRVFHTGQNLCMLILREGIMLIDKKRKDDFVLKVNTWILPAVFLEPRRDQRLLNNVPGK